jgi:hypothetical protein
VLLQARTWGGPQFDEGSGVATAQDNSVYVTGTTLSFGAGDRDALKYDATGVLAWQRTFGTAPSEPFFRADEFARAVAVSPDELAIYISGQFGNGSLFLARFDPAGTLVWTIFVKCDSAGLIITGRCGSLTWIRFDGASPIQMP